MKALKCRKKGRKGTTTPKENKFRTGLLCDVTHLRCKRHQWMHSVKMYRMHRVANITRMTEGVKRNGKQKKIMVLILKNSLRLFKDIQTTYLCVGPNNHLLANAEVWTRKQ